MARRLSALLGFWGVGLCAYPLASNGLGRLSDREFEQLRQAHGPLTYVVHAKTSPVERGRTRHRVELRLISGSHGLPAWGVRLDPEPWARVQVGDRWEAGATPGGSPTFLRSVQGIEELPLLPYLPLGGLCLGAAVLLRRRE